MSLAGDEIGESKDSQLPSLWKDVIRGGLEGHKICNSRNGQVSTVWLPKSMERWETTFALGRAATLPMPKLWPPFLASVENSIARFQFLFFCLFRRLKLIRRLPFEY